MEVTSVEQFLAHWERVHLRTARVVASVPRERFDWAPAAGAFTFADLVRHLAAIERHMFVENVCGRWSRYPGHGRELADGPERVLAYYDALHDESVHLVAAMSDADLLRPCTTPAGATMARGKWLRAMVEHEVHHRGQIYLMLRLIGVPTPALYGLTSEQVLAKSRPPAADA